MKNVKSTRPIVLTIIGVLILILIALGVFYKIKVVGDPVNLTTIALRNMSNGIKKNSNLKKILSFVEENDAIETKMTGNITLPAENGKISFDALIEDDKDNEEAIMNLNVLHNGTRAIHLEGQLDEFALYYAFRENPTKYYYLSDIKYSEDLNELDYEDFFDKFIESFRDVVTKKDFSISEKEITVNNETIKAKQYSLNFNQKLNARLTNRIIEKVLMDEDLVEDLADLTGMTELELRSRLEENKMDLKTLENPDDISFIYNVYVYNNTAVRFEFVDSSDANSNIKIDNYRYFEIIVNALYSYEDSINISLKNENKIWTINGNYNEYKVDGIVDEKKYDIAIYNNEMNIKLIGNQNFDQYKNSITFTENGKLSITQNDTTIEVPYDFNINLKKIKRVNRKIITNKVDINNMTPEEKIEFNTELSQIPLFSMMGLNNDITSDYSAELHYNNGINSYDNNYNAEITDEITSYVY